MRFARSVAPFVKPSSSVRGVMLSVALALSPAMLAHAWFFGPGILITAVIAAGVAAASEALALKLRNRPIASALGDGSALVTALLLAFALPPLTPWWITAIGAAFAILFAKQLYGGLGFNPFNPAMAGYAVLLISFPVELTRWLPPRGLVDAPTGLASSLHSILTGNPPGAGGWDALTMATPLDYARTELARMATMTEIHAHPLFGDFAGRGWEWISNWVALGGLWLLYRRVIRWHIPVGVLAGIIGIASVFFVIDPGKYGSPGFHVFAGATMLCAFFIATDPVSAPSTTRGRLLFGLGIGVLIYVIRVWGGYPDGVAFAVLLMNMTSPLLERYTMPRIYGHERR